MKLLKEEYNKGYYFGKTRCQKIGKVRAYLKDLQNHEFGCFGEGPYCGVHDYSNLSPKKLVRNLKDDDAKYHLRIEFLIAWAKGILAGYKLKEEIKKEL